MNMEGWHMRSPETQKYISFNDESMLSKPVYMVPGIGPIYTQRLRRLYPPIVQATQLYGQYLINPRDFRERLINTINMLGWHADACVRAFDEWTQRYM